MGSCFSRVDSDYEVVTLNGQVVRLKNDVELLKMKISDMTANNGCVNGNKDPTKNDTQPDAVVNELKSEVERLRTANGMLKNTVRVAAENIADLKSRLEASEKTTWDVRNVTLAFAEHERQEKNALKRQAAELQLTIDWLTALP
jgi:predicted nuclease with TOPRIM domain